MKRITTWLLAGALGAGMGVGGRVLAAESESAESGHAHERVSRNELPKPVRETLDREAKGAKVEELRKETRKDGSLVYEAEIVKRGEGTEIEINQDGMVVERGKPHDERTEKQEKK